MLVHQHAGRNRRSEVVTFVNQLGQHRDIGLFQCIDAVQIPEFKLGHTATLFLRDDINVYAVMLEDFDKIFSNLGAIVVPVTRCIERDLARGVANGFWLLGLQQRLDPFAKCFAMQLG